ncbi:MAG: hypothetical protein AAF629_26230 [Chloroflexota bacterium]
MFHPSNFWSSWSPTYFQDLVAQHLTPGGLILIPYFDTLEPLFELYQADGKVIAANLNQLPLLWAKAKSTQVDHATLNRSFIQLGDMVKGGQSLRSALTQLYQTQCPNCHEVVSAHYFIWNRTLADPQQKKIICPNCVFDDLVPVTDTDLARLDQIETRGVHYHFLFGRVAGPNLAAEDRLRSKLETWHDLYTPRNIYVLAELIMKLEASNLDRSIQTVFKAILLSCLLQASNLYGQNPADDLPKRLKIPIQSVEHNVWHLFETAIAAWPTQARSIRFSSRMQDMLEMRQNSLYLFPDRAERLKRYLPNESLSLVITAPPMLNTHRWALTTLWAGWLLGLKAAEANYTFLQRRASDWPSYQKILFQAFYLLRPALKPDAPWHVILHPEHRLQPLTIIIAALRADYDVDAWEINTSHQTLTFLINVDERPTVRDLPELTNLIQAEIRDVVKAQEKLKDNETELDHLHWVSWQSLLYSGLLAQAVASLSEKRVVSWLSQQTTLIIEGHG